MINEEEQRKFERDIVHTTDGPVTAFVLIARVVDAVAAGRVDLDIAKNSLYELLVERGSLRPTNECEVCGGVDEGNTCCPQTIISIEDIEEPEPECTGSVVHDEFIPCPVHDRPRRARRDTPSTIQAPNVSMADLVKGNR